MVGGCSIPHSGLEGCSVLPTLQHAKPQMPVSQSQQETHRLVVGSRSSGYGGGCGMTILVADVLPVALHFSLNSSWGLWPVT